MFWGVIRTMSDAIDLKESVLPWAPPNLDREPEIIRQFGIPLGGVVCQGGNSYFFCCVVGEAALANLWVYLLVTPEEIEEVRAWGATPAALDALLADNREYVVALNQADHGILAWGSVRDPASHESLLDAAIKTLGLEGELLHMLETAYA